MELRVLGPLQVYVNGAALPLGTRKQRIVLALLAINHARVVDMDALVDALWPEAPPTSAVPNVRGYAGNLRRLFESAGSGELRIIRQHGGYALVGAESTLDLVAFDRDVAGGDEALDHGDLPTATARFRNALGRWRGNMLAGMARGPGLADRLPRELPPAIGHFVGREREADAILTALTSVDERTRCRPSVVVCHGPGGSGKCCTMGEKSLWRSKGNSCIDRRPLCAQAIRRL